MWDWAAAAKAPNAACGPHGDDGPPDISGTLRQLQGMRRRGAKCAAASGPYPFPDGPLEIVGRDALRAVFGAPRVRAFAAAAYAQRSPPFWTHEDAAVGALVYREAETRQLPLTYVALRRWKHHRAWINWADRSTLVDGNAMYVHYTRDAARADYCAAAFAATARLPSDGFVCGGCEEQWGWRAAPSSLTICCSKPRTRRREPPPRRAPAAAPPGCGLSDGGGGGGARLQLAILAEPVTQDLRARVRGRLATARGGATGRAGGSLGARNGSATACFVLDTQQRHRAPTHGFNLRAWLHYEAALHADLSLEPLQPHGTWAAAPQGARQWLRRAAAHARGGGAARHYAVATAEALAALPPEALKLLLLGEPDATPLPASAWRTAPVRGALDWCRGRGWACCAARRPPACGVFVVPAAALRSNIITGG